MTSQSRRVFASLSQILPALLVLACAAGCGSPAAEDSSPTEANQQQSASTEQPPKTTSRDEPDPTEATDGDENSTVTKGTEVESAPVEEDPALEITSGEVTVPLEFESGISLLHGPSDPTWLEMSAQRPEWLSTEPPAPEAGERFYGVFMLGSRKVPMVFDVADDATRLYFDPTGEGAGLNENTPGVSNAGERWFSCELRWPLSTERSGVNADYALRVFTTKGIWRKKRLAIYPRCHWNAKVAIRGETRSLAIVDENLNGTFADDAVCLDVNRDGRIQPAERLKQGDVVELAGTYLQLTSVAPSGEQIQFTPWEPSAGDVDIKRPELVKGENLARARLGFETQLTKQAPSPKDYDKEMPVPDIMQEVTYRSGDLELKAWVTKDPGSGKKYPAVVFVHAGASFDLQDFGLASLFMNKGYVIMLPMLRGENGNPGHYESFYGEVNDVIDAGEYAAGLPYVDPDRVFVAGQHSGAVLTVLTAMMPSPYKAAAAINGYLDTKRWAKNEAAELVVFDRTNPDEIALRNPMGYVPSLQIPIALLIKPAAVGWGNARFYTLTKQYEKPAHMAIIPGKERDVLGESIERAADWFQQHSGPAAK